MLRYTALRYPPKPSVGKAFWDTLQKKGMKEAGKFAKTYAKDFSKTGQGQDLYRKMAKTTAAAEAKVKATFMHYWNAFHEVKSNIKTGPAETASDAGGSGSTSSSGGGGSGGGGGGTSGRRSFFQRADDFWRNNKEYIMSFLAANFMAVVFAFQYGSQVWGLVSGLWNVYWQNAAIKAKKLEEARRREEALRLAQEESEDALDDVYGGTLTDDHVLKRGGVGDPASHGIANQAPNRAASATTSAMDEEALQKRLARREERRRRKELEESGLVMHDDHFARREEERQNSLLTGTPLSRKLEKEEVRQMSGMELLASSLLKQEEEEHIDGALSSTDMSTVAQKERAAMEAYWRKQEEMRRAKKHLSKKVRRKIRKAQREKELQAFFAERDAKNSQSSLTTENTAADSAAKMLAFTDSFSYSVGDQGEAKSFAAEHDQTHNNFNRKSLVSSFFGSGGRGAERDSVFARFMGNVSQKQQAIFDFTSFDKANSASTSAGGGKRGGTTKAEGNVHDFTSATA